jgi:hypothetical protein
MHFASTLKVRMEISKPVVAFVALMLLGANVSAQSDPVAPPRVVDQAGQNALVGSIVKGRALYEDTNQPAPRMRVQLVAIELLTNRRGPNRIPTAMTDANGEFIFLHAVPGEYYVVTHPVDEHVPSAEGSPFPLQNGDPVADAARLEQYKKDFPKITVNANNPIEINLRVKNPHFGSIEGRVASANGGAVANAKVHAMKTGEHAFGAATITDENGAYRLRGLPAGEYIVGADPPQKTLGAEGSKTVTGVLGSTYFPSTIDSRTSPPVVVSRDGEVSDINITLAERSLHTVAGTVRHEGDGHPVVGATVRLNKKDENQTGIEAAMSIYFSTTDEQGRWLLNNLPDGVYAIDVRPSGLLSSKAERFVNKKQDLTIAGADVENFTIEVSSGFRVSGHVTVEQKSGPAPDISIGIGSAFARVETNGEFTANGVPEGEFPLTVMIRPQNVFYAKSIEVNGVDLLREKLKTNVGSEIKNVRIAIAPASIFTGRVLSASGGTPLSNAFIMLMPVDPSTAPAFTHPNGSTNEQGVFTLSGAPGEYFVVLKDRREPGPPQYVGPTKTLSPNSMRITLEPGQRKKMDLVMQ